MKQHKKTLLKKIHKGDAQIGIIGLGYVGLPLAIAFAQKGFPTLGFDIDAQKIKILNKGKCYILHCKKFNVK